MHESLSDAILVLHAHRAGCNSSCAVLYRHPGHASIRMHEPKTPTHLLAFGTFATQHSHGTYSHNMWHREGAVPSVAAASALSSSCDGSGVHLHTNPAQHSPREAILVAPAPGTGVSWLLKQGWPQEPFSSHAQCYREYKQDGASVRAHLRVWTSRMAQRSSRVGRPK